MKKTIKIIDLLNIISKGEEVPERIKYENNIFIAKGNVIDGFIDYVCDDLDYCFTHYINWSTLNDEVEIIEEPKKIEKIEMYQDEEGHYFLNKQDRKVYVNCDEMDFMINKFNELIDEINNLKVEE